MAKDSKFGAFGGVYTPSLLTILGVIMYLRLPWVTGHAGLGTAISIVVVAHVISIATGLSISSVATDKNVGAGGPYYIVSRSLGLPIGGALGLALFVGLGFSASLYVIGFAESFLGFLDIERTPTAIRITGTITLLVLTAVTVISTAFAIKTQYFILALIVASLLAIFLGDPANARLPTATEPSALAPSLPVLFGIFFPAVTGFTAGVNMSGDLRNPKKSIPGGTLAAIFTGMVVYLGLVVYLGTRVPKEILVADQDVLLHIALHPAPVIAGIWGATLSSGLGSMMGAPRILQALSRDAVTPRIFARGTGPTSEPRNALIVAFLLAEAGILIAELDAIARIVSMVFLTMYCFLNLSCAIEAGVSPDFRPTFRIPKTVSLAGFATCVVVMIQLDLAAMAGAVALMVGLFVWLSRRQLELESGDAWHGIWSAIVRTGLYRLTTGSRAQQRNWQPNIIGFHAPGAEGWLRLSEQLITGSGLLTRFLVETKRKAELRTRALDSSQQSRDARLPSPSQDGSHTGIFRRRLPFSEHPFDSISALVQHFGFSGLEPNTLLLDYSLRTRDEAGFLRTLASAEDRDFNVLVHADKAGPALPPARAKIDVWWRADAGNVSFSLALLRFLTRASVWEHAQIRFFLCNPDTANSDNLRTAMRRILRDSRIDATVKLVSSTVDDRPFVDQVRSFSQDSALVLLGLARSDEAFNELAEQEVQQLAGSLERTLFIRGSSAFPEVLPTGRSAAVSSVPPIADGNDGPSALPDLKMPDTPDIAQAAREMTEAYQRLVARLHDQCLRKVYGRHSELLRGFLALAEHHLAPDRGFVTDNPRRQLNAFNRRQSSLLLESQQRLTEFLETDLADLRSIIDGGADAFRHDDQVADNAERWLLVTRPRQDFSKREGDSAYVRRFKRRRRIESFLLRRDPRYRIPLAPLRRYYFERAKKELLEASLRQLTHETYQIVIQLSRVLNSMRAELLHSEGDVVAVVTAQRQQLTSALSELDHMAKRMSGKRHWALVVGALELSQAYANDIDRLDVLPLIKKERRTLAKKSEGERQDLGLAWAKNQAELLERAKLALSLSSVQHRLAAITRREREALLLGLASSALRECETLRDTLVALKARLDEGPTVALELKLSCDTKNLFDPRPVTDALLRDALASLDALPTSVDTITDEGIQALEEGQDVEIETVELPVRRLLQFLVESELVAAIQERLTQVLRSEQRALTVASDAARLVSFQLAEFDPAEPPSAVHFSSQMQPAVQSAIERVESEIASLSKLSLELGDLFEERLQQVIELSHPFELSRASERLLKHMRVRKGQRAVSGLHGIMRGVEQKLRSTAVRIVYHKSEGVLLAKRRQAELIPDERSADAIADVVRRAQPSPEALEQLPFYYRQLFMGQSGINDTFWVGRREEIARARQALREFDAGKSGALFITGDRLSGKSALLQRLTAEVLEKRRIVRVHAPAGGNAEPSSFDQALLRALDVSGAQASAANRRDAFAALPRGCLVFVDDAQLFWQRSPGGERILRRLLAQVDSQGGRALFVLSFETHAFRFISQFIPLADKALAVLDCAPVSAEALQEVITLRHASTGMKFQLGSKREEDISPLTLARHFSSIFDESQGNIGAALRAWLAQIRKVRGDLLEIAPRARANFGALDALRPEWTAVLTQLILHKQLTETRLEEISGLPRHALRPDLTTLVRMGLVTETQKQVLELAPHMVHPVIGALTRRGIIA